MQETNRIEYKRELTPELDIEKADTSISALIKMAQPWE